MIILNKSVTPVNSFEPSLFLKYAALQHHSNVDDPIASRRARSSYRLHAICESFVRSCFSYP